MLSHSLSLLPSPRFKFLASRSSFFTPQGADDNLGDPDIGFDYQQLADAMQDVGGIDMGDDDEDDGGEGEGKDEGEEEDGDKDEADKEVDDDGMALLDEVDALEDSEGEGDEDSEGAFELAPGAAEYLAAARAKAALESAAGAETGRKRRNKDGNTAATLAATIGRPFEAAEEPGEGWGGGLHQARLRGLTSVCSM
jgi:hypothetical protein